MTLDRLLSRYGLASRTAAARAIEAGRLKVNGRIMRDPNYWVTPSRDAVQLDGQRLRAVRKVYRVFYKPKGVITSHGDAARAQDCLRLFLRRRALVISRGPVG